MFPTSIIDRAVIQAYLETHYIVHGNHPTTLKIGENNPILRALHSATNVQSSAFLTACNPFSRSFDAQTNARLQNDLAHALRRRGFLFIDGVGQHPSNDWPGEASFLVFGLSLEEAKNLAIQFEQNAFVYSGANAVPELILLR